MSVFQFSALLFSIFCDKSGKEEMDEFGQEVTKGNQLGIVYDKSYSNT